MERSFCNRLESRRHTAATDVDDALPVRPPATTADGFAAGSNCNSTWICPPAGGLSPKVNCCARKLRRFGGHEFRRSCGRGPFEMTSPSRVKARPTPPILSRPADIIIGKGRGFLSTGDGSNRDAKGCTFPEGFEPSASRLTVPRSYRMKMNQLSYGNYANGLPVPSDSTAPKQGK